MYRDSCHNRSTLLNSLPGHLVFSSIHTNDVASTINRLVSFFPTEEHAQVRNRLAENLKAVVSLRLLLNKKKTGRVPAVEIMRTTLSIKECLINPEKTSGVYDFIKQGGDQYGMQTFDQHLFDLYEQGRISVEVAKAAATSAADFERNLVYS